MKKLKFCKFFLEKKSSVSSKNLFDDRPPFNLDTKIDVDDDVKSNATYDKESIKKIIKTPAKFNTFNTKKTEKLVIFYYFKILATFFIHVVEYI